MREVPISTTVKLSVVDTRREIESMDLVLDHPLQRRSQQWTLEQKSNLIRRILQKGEILPLIVCTQRDENGCEVNYWTIVKKVDRGMRKISKAQPRHARRTKVQPD